MVPKTPQPNQERGIHLAPFCILLSLLWATGTQAAEGFERFSWGAWESIQQDYGHFYSGASLARMGLVLSAGAVLANTQADSNVQSWYQDHVRSSGTDEVASVAKVFGEGKYLIPLSLLASGLFYYDGESKVGQWGWRTTRAFLTGGPALLVMQYATGASRPGEGNDPSRWRPFHDSQGVSGHAFVGAVPFLTLGNLYEDNKLVQYTAYALSTAAAWSRLNDDAHFLSQVGLGWYLAWESTRAIEDTEKNRSQQVAIAPLITDRGLGIALTSRW